MDTENNHIITTNIMGGLGNQLFQIAHAYVYSLKYSTQFMIDRSLAFYCGQGQHPSNYANSIYKKIMFIHSFDHINHIFKEYDWGNYCNFEQVNNIISSNIPQVIKFDGYFQSDRYFGEYASKVKELFTPEGGIISYIEQNSDFFNHFPELKEPNDFCFIGIRRGDYVSRSQVHNPCGMTYFNKAMNMMNKKMYYISTDDYEWAKKNFTGDNIKFLDIDNHTIQFYSLCLFKNYIISNSTYHWWASFLSIYDNPRIIAPDKWITLGTTTYSAGSNIYRKDMEIIERPVETT